jgi:hypothetical protein
MLNYRTVFNREKERETYIMVDQATRVRINARCPIPVTFWVDRKTTAFGTLVEIFVRFQFRIVLLSLAGRFSWSFAWTGSLSHRGFLSGYTTQLNNINKNIKVPSQNSEVKGDISTVIAELWSSCNVHWKIRTESNTTSAWIIWDSWNARNLTFL